MTCEILNDTWRDVKQEKIKNCRGHAEFSVESTNGNVGSFDQYLEANGLCRHLSENKKYSFGNNIHEIWERPL